MDMGRQAKVAWNSLIIRANSQFGQLLSNSCRSVTDNKVLQLLQATAKRVLNTNTRCPGLYRGTPWCCKSPAGTFKAGQGDSSHAAGRTTSKEMRSCILLLFPLPACIHCPPPRHLGFPTSSPLLPRGTTTSNALALYKAQHSDTGVGKGSATLTKTPHYRKLRTVNPALSQLPAFSRAVILSQGVAVRRGAWRSFQECQAVFALLGFTR